VAFAAALAMAVPAGASAATGVISGQITDETTGQGIDGICAQIFDSAGNGAGGGQPDSQGNYSFGGLSTGSYKAEFFPCADANYVTEFFNNKATYDAADPVSVTDGQTTTVNAALAHGGMITGTVTNDNGDPVANICVSAELHDLSGGAPVSASTDSNGHYTLTGVPAGSLSVAFIDCAGSNYVTQYWDNKPDFESATPVPVTADATTSNISPTLHHGGSFSGTVTDAGTGTPLQHIAVCAYANGLCADTDASGHYTFGRLAAGSVRVGFFDLTNTHRTQYYNGRPDLASADPITVVADANTPNIDAALALSTAPVTHPTSGPAETTSSTTATIGFVADQSPVTYECDLDGLGFQPCTSPVTYTCLNPGSHTLRVRATNQAGEVESPPAQGSWTVTPGASCTTTGGTANPGDIVTTDPGGTGPTPSEPVTTSVSVPAGGTGGTVSVTDNPYPGPAPSGYTIFGHELQIAAPDQTTNDPLRLVFTLDASAIPSGTDPSTITVFRNGVAAGACLGSNTANPDPCIANRQTVTGGDLQIAVLSSHASTWDLAGVMPQISTPPTSSAAAAAPVPSVAPAKKCKKAKKRSASAAKCKKKKK
jgi:hypothetical protein